MLIDSKNTSESNDLYPSESECTLKRNVIIDKIILIDNQEKVVYEKVNTGMRTDSWVE